MVAQQDHRVPKATFRVLIIGRVNSGKTSILQRVCDTTESPEIYRPGPLGRRKQVRSRSLRHF
jgi:GTPase SAR1 family protein